MNSEQQSVLEKVKKFVGLAPADPLAVDLTGINQPWHLARCDAAIQVLVPLFRAKIFVKSHQERKEYYAKLSGMVADIIDSLKQINLFRRRFQQTKPDPTEPHLQIIRTALDLLRENATLCGMISSPDFESQKMLTDVIPPLRALDDAAADSEVELLHNVSELLEAIAQPLQRNSEVRKRALGKSDLERYNRAFCELQQYYESR